jgi:hypothetical protein
MAALLVLVLAAEMAGFIVLALLALVPLPTLFVAIG